MARWIQCLIVFIALAGCNKKPTVTDSLESFESDWTIAAPINLRLSIQTSSSSLLIEDDLEVELAGHKARMGNYIQDSRGTVMDFGEWYRLLLGTNLSDHDRLKRIPMLGGAGELFPFLSDKGNRGFLILGTDAPQRACAELWDSEGVQRIRIEFEGVPPTRLEVESIAQELAGLRWPIEKIQQGGDGDA